MNTNDYPYGFVRISGQDRQTFLQGQLTCDMRQINTQTATIAACCEANGRAVASMLLFEYQDHYLALLPKGCDQLLIDHLQKYAIFSKVTLESVDITIAINDSETVDSIALPGNIPAWLTINANQGNINYQQLHTLMIDHGVALIPAELSSKLIPLMLNYDQLGGISFNKGCYVGQEIIARMHYKGQLKRHLQCITSATELPIGADIVNDAKQTLGVVVLAQGNNALAVIQDRGLEQPLFCHNEPLSLNNR